MHRSDLIVSLALASAAFGCQSGCDGERGARVPLPRHPEPSQPSDSGFAIVPSQDAEEIPKTLGFLDAPPGTLDAFFGGLDSAERRDASGRVLMLLFGDSHTAGDSMTSRLRVTWQQRFGDAGRGLVAAGKPPTKHYYQRDVRYGTYGDWKASVGGHKGDSEPFGIAGIRVSGKGKGAELWVETCSECAAGQSVGQFEIFYYSAPDHGVLRYRVDEGPWQEIATKTAAIEPPHPGRQVLAVVDGPHRLTLQHGGGGTIDLFGVVMERMKPGVIVDSLGVVGRRLGSLRSWDWSIIGEQLSTRDPRLVVLQYGTNESDDPDLNLDDLARYYDETILRIRAAAPTASILILGPPDVGVREGGKACERVKPGDAGVIPECEWRTPSVLGEIISVEHAAAVRNHVAFFDTFAAMGGADRMDSWFNSDPKVAYKDRVHFTDIGYQRWADVLTGALLAGYEQWRHSLQLPPTRAMIPLPPLKAGSDAPSPGAPPP